MSIEALKWAFEQEDVPPGPRFVLVALANRANEEGGDLYPSLGWIHRKTGIPARTIRHYMAELQGLGLLLKTERRRDDGGRTSNEYRLPLAQPGLRFTPPATVAVGGDAVAVGERQPLPGAPATIAGHKTKELTPSLKPRGTTLPDNFTISPSVRKWARDKGYEPYLELHFEHFVNYAQGGTQGGKPVLALNWDAKFRACVTADWGDVRAKAKRTMPPRQNATIAGKSCGKCGSSAVFGSVNGKSHCDARACRDWAMFGEKAA